MSDHKVKRFAWSIFAIAALQSTAAHTQGQLVSLPPNSAGDVYFQVNMSGTVFVNVMDPEGAGCAEFWWILWPFGNIKELGRHCGGASFEIPRLMSLSISSKLRAATGSRPVKIGVADKAEVAHSIRTSFDAECLTDSRYCKQQKRR